MREREEGVEETSDGERHERKEGRMKKKIVNKNGDGRETEGRARNGGKTLEGEIKKSKNRVWKKR